MLYSIAPWSVVYAVDARTGKEVWRSDPDVNLDGKQYIAVAGGPPQAGGGGRGGGRAPQPWAGTGYR